MSKLLHGYESLVETQDVIPLPFELSYFSCLLEKLCIDEAAKSLKGFIDENDEILACTGKFVHSESYPPLFKALDEQLDLEETLRILFYLVLELLVVLVGDVVLVLGLEDVEQLL